MVWTHSHIHYAVVILHGPLWRCMSPQIQVPDEISQLTAVRRGTPAGSVQDLHRKHLLALILRQDERSSDYVPRSYLLPPTQGPYRSEWESFQRDFELSSSLASLANALKFGEQREVEVLLPHCQQLCARIDKALDHLGADAKDAMIEAELLLRRVEELPWLQMKINEKNWWLLKPVDGAVGKGIVLFGGLGSEKPLEIPSEIFKGRATDGFILQKYVERPHLLDDRKLLKVEQAKEVADMELVADVPMFKYNLRHWVLIRWTGADPPVWLYEKGYIELCFHPFSATLESGSHIANLAPEPGQSRAFSEPTVPCKRMWSTDVLARYLEATTGSDVWSSRILPQLHRVVANTVAAACPLRSFGAQEDGEPCDLTTQQTQRTQRQPWRRFGFDFTLDEDLQVWLIEVNHKPGMKSPKGWVGEAKRRLLADFYSDERDLCGVSLEEKRDNCVQPIGAFRRVNPAAKMEWH
eukprot:s1313_g3.t1